MATKNDLRIYYKGFSSKKYHDVGGSFEIHNIDCIIEDLMNHLFTIKGERYHMPDFGTRIPTMIFEINDAESQEDIREDIEAVMKYDPRVKLLKLELRADTERHVIAATATVNFLQFNVTRDLNIEIKSQ